MAFEVLEEVKSDSILGLMTEFNNDPAEMKVDLIVGVYRNNRGETPVMAAVSEAEKRIWETQVSKKYAPPIGVPGFRSQISQLVLGEAHAELQERLSTLQTPGGCGALRVGAEFYKRACPEGSAFVSDPTWGNHLGLFSAAGLRIEKYPYYDPNNHRLLIEELLTCLSQAAPGSLVLLQACCHNPTGSDPSAKDWSDIFDVIESRQFVPFFDLAYQGLGSNLDDDANVVRAAVKRFPEVLIAVSCSKNFGLYRERTGALLVVSKNARQSKIVESHIENVARGTYSMAPAHGALIVEGILTDKALRAQWASELESMTARLAEYRNALAAALSERHPEHNASWIRNQIGMFSLLGLSTEQVEYLKHHHHIYIVRNSRINFAGLNDQNIQIVAEALTEIGCGELDRLSN